MTSRSRRKRRTTARRSTRLRTAVKLATLIALFGGGPVAAQQPYRPPAADPARSLPAPGQGLPPGYRQAATTRTVADRPASEPAGRVLYFHKPAGTLVPTPNPDTGPELAGAAVPDVPVSAPASDRPVGPAPPAQVVAPGFVPPPLPKYLPPDTTAAAQPQTTSTSQRKQDLPKVDPKVDPRVTQLPPRSAIFTLYDDPTLEKLIVASLRKEIQERKEREPGAPVEPLKDDERYWQFPDLRAVQEKLSPPGTAYQAKTVTYPPWKAIYEPNYVVHRRLHFEEKNSDRYGWDLGFVQPFVSAAYFYKDTLLWPNSLASGFKHGFWDTSAGKCLPGSPVPYYLYPPGLTVTGTVVEAAVVTGVAIVIP